jgi:DNA-binding LytR/AlgR family response regulator
VVSLRIAICDDDPAELQRIRNTTAQFSESKLHEHEITVHAFASGADLLRTIKKQDGFDLIILDILLPGMNGIELAQQIRENGDDCKILFLTSSPEFAIDSYRVNAFYYLLKPFSESELVSLIGRALLAMEDERNTSIVVKSRGKITRLRLSTIQYIESVNHNVNFHLRDGGFIDCFSSLNEFHGALLVDRRFVQCHKSFIVNMDYVTGISGKEFALAGNTQVPISRNVYQQVKDAYFDYFFDKGNRR